MINKKVLQHQEVMNQDEIDQEGNWAISYGDMITLLLTFFILYFNASDQKQKQEDLIQESILTEFNPSRIPVRQRTIASETENPTLESRTDFIDGRFYKNGAKIFVEFPKTEFFTSGSTEVTEAGKKMLISFTDRYVKYAGNHILNIKAFTDSKAVTKGKYRFHDNLELSALRSISAMRVLQYAGIPLHKMKIAGQGELKSWNRLPASEQTPEQIKQFNSFDRKIVLVIESDSAKVPKGE